MHNHYSPCGMDSSLVKRGGILHLPVLFSYVHVIFSGLLKSSAPSRLINVSSFMHAYGQLDVQNLDFYKICRPFEAFYNSHLGIVMATRELYRTLKQTGEAPYEISLFLYSDFFSQYLRMLQRQVITMTKLIL